MQCSCHEKHVSLMTNCSSDRTFIKGASAFITYEDKGDSDHPILKRIEDRLFIFELLLLTKAVSEPVPHLSYCYSMPTCRQDPQVLFVCQA
ncbi:hypothetical protein AVEN_208651-1 [Araneus ventricosus]|uniref:Uncharacterized protein n=1 Tax=Araneus ventricosus TaxID=182803 RepID=A0A4Y2DU08_ARAVE|nr:hypothetical protein AVEN_208651-1 [Araneus ventricosus]